MTNPTVVPRRARAAPGASSSRGMRCRVRLADGRMFAGELPAERHRALQLGILHAGSDGLVELAAGARRDGNLAISTRNRADHFLPGGNTGQATWLERLLALAGSHADRGEEVFAAPAVRREARGDRHAVTHTRALWVDVDEPGQLPGLWAFLAAMPCHLLIQSGGGGAHAYWLLDQPLPAIQDMGSGKAVEPIERAHLRLIHHLGVGPDGKPDVADLACKDRSRLMRLAGTVNGKTGQHARILEADFQLAPYPIAALVGDLADPPSNRRGQRTGSAIGQGDPYKQISPPEYFETLAGIEVPRDGLVRCPASWQRTGIRRARLGSHQPRGGVATPARAARAARSTTWRPCCSAGPSVRSCAERRSSAPARTWPTCSARSPKRHLGSTMPAEEIR